MPHRRIACGACSRDEPQPKFAFTSRIDASGVGAIRDRMGAGRARVGLDPVVLEQVLLEPLERDRSQEPRGDDPIRVDADAAQRQARSR